MSTVPSSPHHDRRYLFRHAPALLCVAVPAIVWLAPMLRDPVRIVFGPEGDNLFFVRQFWWLKHALIDLRRPFLFDSSAYFPYGYSLTRGELTPINTLFGLPVTLLAGPVAAYNNAVLLTFLLTGWATYAWTFVLTRSRAGAIAAGVIAEMAPYRLAHATGHLALLATQGFPLALWTFELYLATPTRRRAIALGSSAAVVAWSSWYYAYSLVLLLPLYVLLRMRASAALRLSRAWWSGLLVAVGVGAALTLPYAAPYMRAAHVGDLTKSYGEMLSWSLNYYDFFIPNPTHPLWSDAMRTAFPVEASEWVERSVSLGYVALALAVVGASTLRLSGTASPVPFVVIAVVSGLIALGPLLRANDRFVLIQVPQVVGEFARSRLGFTIPAADMRASTSQSAVPVPLPTTLLVKFVPVTSAMRVMARFAFWPVLMVAALAAWGVAALQAGAFGADRRAGRLLAALAIAACTFESWSQRSLSRWEPRAVDHWLATRPSRQVVVELPLTEALRPAQDYYVTVHQQATVFGPIGDTFQSPVLFARRAILASPSQNGIAALRAWGTTVILLDPSKGPDAIAWREVLRRSDFQPQDTVGGIEVYQVR